MSRQRVDAEPRREYVVLYLFKALGAWHYSPGIPVHNPDIPSKLTPALMPSCPNALIHLTF
jgi:hypothetical protein